MLADWEVEVMSGRAAVLRRAALLESLGERLGQQGTMEHLDYFLHFKDASKKKPCLVLLSPTLLGEDPNADDVTGAVLLFEYQVLGVSCGVFAADDESGRRTLLAPDPLRLTVARRAAEALMERGARAVFLCFVEAPNPALGTGEENQALLPRPLTRRNAAWRLGTQLRLVRSHLPLLDTFDETLARIGQRTRSNMRYYRRRAEKELGCTFVPTISGDRLSRWQFKQLNRRSKYAVSNEEAARRYESILEVPGGFLCGIHDAAGDWLAVLGGRRFHDAVEIDWQSNRDDLPTLSLSTVLRAYLIEHEIGRGTRRLFIEGGTPHALRFSFSLHLVRDLIVIRSLPTRRWLAPAFPLLRSFVQRVFPRSAFLLKTLTSAKLAWRSWS